MTSSASGTALVLLWSARVSGLTRSVMVKLPALAIYKDMTVRNVNTTRRVLTLMNDLESADA